MKGRKCRCRVCLMKNLRDVEGRAFDKGLWTTMWTT